MTLFVKSHQGAAVKSPERSVRQLIWVFAGLLLYTPLEVRSCAYNHAIATVKSTANLSHIGLFDFKNWGRYCKSINQQQTWKLKSNKNHNHQTSNDRDTHIYKAHLPRSPLHLMMGGNGFELELIGNLKKKKKMIIFSETLCSRRIRTFLYLLLS